MNNNDNNNEKTKKPNGIQPPNVKKNSDINFKITTKALKNTLPPGPIMPIID
jgi:hypothetical protein